MKTALKSIGRKHGSSACVVDGKLVLSVPGALTPVVWQMDLSQAKASALEVGEGGHGSFTLILKNPKAETIDVASFRTRGEAVDALMAVSRALASAHGQIRPSGPDSQQGYGQPGVRRRRWLGPVAGILTLLLLVWVWLSLNAPASTLTAAQNSSTESGEITAGVPLSADEFLRSR